MTKIIAELSQNHNGDIKVLEDMVHAAAESGADFAKIQSIHSSDLAYRERFEHGLIEGGKIKVIKRPYKAELERLKKLDLDESFYGQFVEFCKKYNIQPMCTAFTYRSLDLLEKYDFKNIKVASFDCASHELIKKICMNKVFENIYVSTGATFNREVKKTAEILKNSEKNYALLHCVSIYPTPIDNAHLYRMNYLRRFSNIVGYSDHSNPELYGNIIPATAIYVGAQVIEKHFTIIDKKKTKDGVVSVNQNQLKELVNLKNMSRLDLKKYIDENIKDYRTLLGLDNRDLSDEELLNRDYYQGRFVTKKEQKHIFNWEKLN